MYKHNTNKDTAIGERHPASTSSQSHLLSPYDFCKYSTAHMAMNTAASHITAQVSAIAIPCIFVMPISASKHDRQPTDKIIITTQIAKPIQK